MRAMITVDISQNDDIRMTKPMGPRTICVEPKEGRFERPALYMVFNSWEDVDRMICTLQTMYQEGKPDDK
jgi:hypothetical protein